MPAGVDEGGGEMSEQFEITLLGGFGVYRDDRPVDLPPSCRRVIALAALKRRALPRAEVCAVLWPTSSPDRATARLRTTLWRLRPLGADALLTVDPHSVAIAPDVSVDWHDAVDLIGRLLQDAAEPDREVVADLLPLLRAGALLNGWTDEWSSHERRSHHTLRMAAIDVLMNKRAAWRATESGSPLLVRVGVNDSYRDDVK